MQESSRSVRVCCVDLLLSLLHGLAMQLCPLSMLLTTREGNHHRRSSVASSSSALLLRNDVVGVYAGLLSCMAIPSVEDNPRCSALIPDVVRFLH